MIKEYINKLLDENNQDLRTLEKQMKDLLGELSCAEEWSETLQVQNHSQINIFSPRNMDTEIGAKIEKSTISIQKIKKEIEYVRDLIETHLKKKDEYEKMLSEIDNSEESVKYIEGNDDLDAKMRCVDNIKDSLEKSMSKEYILGILSELYSKSEICLAFLNSDKNRCKKELNEIKFKIKKYAEEIENK